MKKKNAVDGPSVEHTKSELFQDQRLLHCATGLHVAMSTPGGSRASRRPGMSIAALMTLVLHQAAPRAHLRLHPEHCKSVQLELAIHPRPGPAAAYGSLLTAHYSLLVARGPAPTGHQSVMHQHLQRPKSPQTSSHPSHTSGATHQLSAEAPESLVSDSV